jgi:hypothetical protein
MIDPDTSDEEVMTLLAWYFSQKKDKAVPGIVDPALFMPSSACRMSTETIGTSCADDPWRVRYYLTLFVPPNFVDWCMGNHFRWQIGRAFGSLVQDEMYDDDHLHLTIKALVPEQEQTIGLNNCFFKTEKTILHDELRFRSPAEIAVYDELKTRNILFFPNPAAVLGSPWSDESDTTKKEPDFLICLEGKWGILEINGDTYHSGIVKTTKDHDRAREFNNYGVFFIQAYSAERCRNDACGMVDEFLRLLAKHK